MSDGKYKIHESTDAQFYFNLHAANGQVLVTSERYASRWSTQWHRRCARQCERDGAVPATQLCGEGAVLCVAGGEWAGAG